jgi:ATP-dependent DNA helicase RecG
MNYEQVKKLLKRRERSSVEFKEARRELPRSLFETICSFLNRDGGTILLGVNDAGKVTGVDPDAVDRLTRDIVNLSNNPQKLDPPCILSPKSVDCDGRMVLILRVPASPQVHRCAGVVYDRGHEGDFRVQEPVRIAAIVNRKSGYHTEQVVYPWLKFSDFEPGILDKARSEIKVFYPKHPWLRLSNKDMLLKAGLWREDAIARTKGYTLAAGLLFGKEEVIQQLVPAYKIDALVRRDNVDRYDDRLNIRVNLIDAYDLLMEFVAKHLPDPFYLEGVQRISLREKIFREIVSNLLVHREYTDASPATLIIYRDRVETTNAAIPHGHGPIRPGHFTPFPKNPTLSKFFMQMGRGEELGSGVLNVNKYLPFYAKGAKPRFVEGDPFVTIIPLPSEAGVRTGEESREKSKQKSREKSKQKNSDRLLALIRQKATVTTEELMTALELSRAGVQKIIRKLKKAGRLRRIGPDKGGHWEVV